MAYVSANWNLLLPGVAGAPSLWTGHGVDIHSTANGADFIADGAAKGMKVGDFVMYSKDTATIGATIHVITAVGAVAATMAAAILA